MSDQNDDKKGKKVRDLFKMVLEGTKADGTTQVIGVDLADVNDLKGKVKDLPDGAILAIAESLNKAHEGIHEAMDVLMREGARRQAHKMMKDLKDHPEKAAEIAATVLRAMAEQTGSDDGELGKEISQEMLAAMEPQGHA